ncbi:MAG: hypothetical protein GYA23_02695 [Methanomicrobiales archaeon]|nr:hypothetical protein [Methanomicrobiales archaeon]
MAAEFAGKVIASLAGRVGPASMDMVKDACEKLGIRPDELTMAHMGKFAYLVEEDLAGLLSAAEAKAAADDLRLLK